MTSRRTTRANRSRDIHAERLTMPRNEPTSPQARALQAHRAAFKRFVALHPAEWNTLHAEERVARGLSPSTDSGEKKRESLRSNAIRRLQKMSPEDRALVLGALREGQS